MATLATAGFHGNLERKNPKSGQNRPLARPAPLTEKGGTGFDQPADFAQPFAKSVYQPSRRSGPIAFVASAGTVLAIVAAMLTLNVVREHKAHPRLTAISLRKLDTRPEAAPPPRKLEKVVETPPQVFVPKPDLKLPSPGPVKLALDNPPPVPLTPIAAPAPVKTAAAAPAASSGAAQDGGDLSSNALFIKPPVYPMEARRRHEEGTVKLLVLVGPDGTVDDIEVADSSGSKALDHAALRAVRQWRWKPAKRGGAALAVTGYVIIPFVLKIGDA